MAKKYIDFEKIYESNNSGPFKIIEDLGTDDNYKRKCKIKFINTGYEKIVGLSNAYAGKVKDDYLYNIVNTIISDNKYGPFKIIEDLGMINKCHMYKIRFINTGYERMASINSIKLKTVVDDSLTSLVTDKIYYSNNSGPLKIIEDLGMINDMHRVTVQFLETGYIKEADYQSVLNGKVKDPTNFKTPDIDYNMIYHSNNSGDFMIIEHLGLIDRVRWIIIKFVDTGNIKKVRYIDAMNGEVKDNLRPNVCGIGYIGDGNLLTAEDNMLYSVWRNMLLRCYDENVKNYKYYGSKGVIVCDDWFNFGTFAQDAKQLANYQYKLNNPSLYHLDKDLLQQNIPISERVYSKNTCIWIYGPDNISLSYNNYQNSYLGVTACTNNYYVTININGRIIYIGTYNNIIAAANAYNNYVILNNYNLPLNNVDYMDPVTISKYNISQ